MSKNLETVRNKQLWSFIELGAHSISQVFERVRGFDKIENYSSKPFPNIKCFEIDLKKEDALNRDKWRDGVRAIAEGLGRIRPSLLRAQNRIKAE